MKDLFKYRNDGDYSGPHHTSVDEEWQAVVIDSTDRITGYLRESPAMPGIPKRKTGETLQ
jgi:hypothetical protein